MELCYQNNHHSLFKKYRELVTSLTKHQLYRDYLGLSEQVDLLLPNGYHVIKDKKTAQAIFYTRPSFAFKLYPALYVIDRLQIYFDSIKEAQEVLAWQLGLVAPIPPILKTYHFTVDTFNPNAHPESTTVDGWVYRNNQNETWTDVCNNAGVGVDDSGTYFYSYCNRNDPNTAWRENNRGIMLFDTSSIDNAASISAATLSMYVDWVSNTENHRLCLSTPASNTALQASDYGQLGTVAQATDISISATGTQTFTLNATGIANISLTGVTKLGVQLTAAATLSEPTAGARGTRFYQSDVGSNKPTLSVTYTVSSGQGNLLVLGIGS